MSHLPSVGQATTAGRLAELAMVVAASGRAIPPVPARGRVDSPLRVVFLAPESANRVAVSILLSHALDLARIGQHVTILSHYPAPEGFFMPDGYVVVPFGRLLSDMVPPCELIIAGSWDTILPARTLGIAPVVHFACEGKSYYRELPRAMGALVASSLRAADLTIAPGRQEAAFLAENYGLARIGVIPPLARLTGTKEPAWPGVFAGLLENYQAMIASTSRDARACGDEERSPLNSNQPVALRANSELSLECLEFEDPLQRARLEELAEMSPYRDIAIPVSQPVLRDIWLTRWKAVGRRLDKLPGVARFYLPARSSVAIEDSPFQFGIDLLRAGLAREAFSWFASQCQQAVQAKQVLLGRWVVLSLIEANRAAEAMELSASFAAKNAANADYYMLGLLAALESRRLVDVKSAMEAIHQLGDGALFEEWFEDPSQMVAGRLRVSA